MLSFLSCEVMCLAHVVFNTCLLNKHVIFNTCVINKHYLFEPHSSCPEFISSVQDHWTASSSISLIWDTQVLAINISYLWSPLSQTSSFRICLISLLAVWNWDFCCETELNSWFTFHMKLDNIRGSVRAQQILYCMQFKVVYHRIGGNCLPL